MKNLIFIINLLILIALQTKGQQNDNLNHIDKEKQNYEDKVFNKEFGEDDDTSNLERKLLDRIPEKLPNWLFENSHNNAIRIIAFSDPNLDKKRAFEQAILRAKAIFALFNYCTVSNITDDYTNLVEQSKYSLYATKFQDFTLSKSTLAYNNSNISILDTFYTKYNEGIVFLEFNYISESDLNKDTIEVKAEHLQVFIERNFQKEKVEFFNLSIKDNLDTDSTDFISQYNYKIVNRKYDISSIYGKDIIDYEERTYNYRSEIEFDKDSLSNELNYYRLNRGLWNSYISGLLSNFTSLSKFLATHVKNSNDFYTLKNQGLIRTVSKNKVFFYFESFKLIDNNLYIELNGKVIQ